MAPPKTRRPGFSRRAQYGLFIGYVVAVAGVLFAVLLLIVAMIDPRGFNALRGAALDATLPVTSAGRSVVRFVSELDNPGTWLYHCHILEHAEDGMAGLLDVAPAAR